jgi:hypothetical protein
VRDHVTLPKTGLAPVGPVRPSGVKHQSFLFFWVLFAVNFLTPKLLKIRWSSLFWGSFAPHFQIKLSIHGSNLNSTLIIMFELEFILLTGILNQNYNIVGLVKFPEKKSKTSHFDHSGHIEGDIMQNHEQKRTVKKSEKPRFYGQNKLLF